MAALCEDGRYGLKYGQQSDDRVTVLHVKLTETALKAIESYQNVHRLHCEGGSVVGVGEGGPVGAARCLRPDESLDKHLRPHQYLNPVFST
uniref:RNA polymerase II elongation factor ELL N-terminal domain-containing protein n=1 Tax=Cynoglossus semilaevis TaxID=244447 RepID=A0A3P8X3F9_CYNSE